MSYASLRNEIKKLFHSVEGIGQVHDYRRSTKFWSDYYDRHVKDMQVNNWEITRTAAADDIDAVEGGNQVGNEPLIDRDHSFRIIGHLSLNDEKQSEKQFQDLIENIQNVFRRDPLLSGEALRPNYLQVPLIGHQLYGGVLVHYCEMTYDTTERLGGDINA